MTEMENASRKQDTTLKGDMIRKLPRKKIDSVDNRNLQCHRLRVSFEILDTWNMCLVHHIDQNPVLMIGHSLTLDESVEYMR